MKFEFKLYHLYLLIIFAIKFKCKNNNKSSYIIQRKKNIIMTTNSLIGLSFIGVSFHFILEKIDEIDKNYEDNVFFPKVRELLQSYYKIMEIDEQEQMINHFEIYNDRKIKKLDSKNICDYIDNNFIPYIKGYIACNKRLLEFLTPLIVFNFGKIYEYYNLMINDDIVKFQDQFANSLFEENIYKKKEKEKENKEMMKMLKKNNNNLEKKVIQQNEEIKRLSQEMEKKDEEINKIYQDYAQMEKKIGELDKNAKRMEENLKKEIEKYSKEIESHKKESCEKYKNIKKDVIKIKSKLKMKNKELKITKNAIKNMEYKYEKLKEMQNIIIADDYFDKLAIKQKSQEIFENKLYINKLKDRCNCLDSKNAILKEENIRIKQLIGNKSCEKIEKDKKESLEFIIL